MNSEVSERVCDFPRQCVLETMVAYYRVIGCGQFRARCPGLPAPGVLEGRLTNHRPDLTCQGRDKKRTWILLTVIMAEDLKDEKMLKNRLDLFSWAVEHLNGPAEMHIAVQGVKLESGTMERSIRSKCEKWGVKFKSLFQI